MRDLLETRFALRGRDRGEAVVYDVDAAFVPVIAAAARDIGARFVTMVACDGRDHLSEHWLFAPSGRYVELAVRIDRANPRVPSVTPVWPAAHWHEREAQDLFGIVPEGHPTPSRLMLNDDYPDGVFPFRKDAARVDYRGPARNNRAFVAEGEGITEIPVGPIHAGIIEPGHFRFSAVGERIVHLDARLFYTHKGIEKLFEGKTPDVALQIAERVCGTCAFTHGFAFALAAERVAGVSPPPRAQLLRVALAEMERLYNHVGDIANICAGASFAVGHMHGLVLKERLQAWNERLTGNRFLRGILAVGGLRFDLSAGELAALIRDLADIGREFENVVEAVRASPAAFDRFETTGILRPDAVEALGVVGVAARASGSKADVRRTHPYAAYDRIPFDVIGDTQGDVLARMRVRHREIEQSLWIVRTAIEALPDGPVVDPVAALPGGRTAVAAVESPRGETVHWLRTAPDGTIDRLRIRSASYMNWAAVPTTVPGNIVPDFPLINKSFELCYSCTDR